MRLGKFALICQHKQTSAVFTIIPSSCGLLCGGDSVVVLQKGELCFKMYKYTCRIN